MVDWYRLIGDISYYIVFVCFSSKQDQYSPVAIGKVVFLALCYGKPVKNNRNGSIP
jgi:hypothetical protein